MTYVSDGTFRSDLEFVFGELKKRKKLLDKMTFDQYHDDLVVELQSLYDLHRTYHLPKLAGMSWSHFSSMAAAWRTDEQGLIDKYDISELHAYYLSNTTEILTDSGNPFWAVGDDGVCIAFDDPMCADVWFDDLGIFLQFLVNLSGVAAGKIPLAGFDKEYAEEIETCEGELFLERSIEAAEEHAQDALDVSLNDDEDTFDPSGLSFLFTGKLASMTRKEAQARVIDIGGKNARSVTKTLDVLVIGDDGSPLYGEGTKGSKQKKADKLIDEGAAIRIISESLFLQLE